MKLKTKIYLLSALLALVTGGMAMWVARDQALNIVTDWALRYAEKQVLYDKVRMMPPILREMTMSRELANSPAIKEWARQPGDAKLAARAHAELESYRLRFADKSYFLALYPSGRYYHNNEKNEFAAAPYRYTLDSAKPADRWFYDIIAQNRDMHINVNPDVNLGVTKLWFDVLIRDGEQILGVAGSGLDLTGFIREVVAATQPGITSLFTDHMGAIQVYRDPMLIDFASISKAAGKHKTLQQLFESPEDQHVVTAAMQEVAQQPNKTVSRRVTMQGQPFFVGVAYLPEIDWYEVTLLDINQLLPLASFTRLLLVFVLSLVVAVLVFNLLLGRLVLSPLSRLAKAIELVHADNFSPQDLPRPPLSRHDEVGHLMRLFYAMALHVWTARQELEARVAERTAALEKSQESLRHLAQHDALTGLANRALFSDRLQQAMAAARRDESELALLFLDLDCFKPVNDELGHAVGDQLLQEVALRMLACVRDSDTVARIGGDEFVLLLRGAEQLNRDAPAVAEKIRQSLCQPFNLGTHEVQISCSIGIAIFPAHGATDVELAHHADQAMYQAKQAGRNQVRLYQSQQQHSDTAG